MLWPRTRYLWFVAVSIVYVLLVLVLHRRLHRFNVPDATDDLKAQWIIHVDKRPSLSFPLVGHCLGQSVASPSGLLPLGSDWLYTAYFDDRLQLGPISVNRYIRVLALLRRRVNLDPKPTFYFRWLQSETGNTTTTTAVAELYEMCENHGRRYGGWILSTNFSGRLPPCSIAVTNDLTSAVEVTLPVFRMTAVDPENSSWMHGATRDRVVYRDETKLPGNFAVCVPPLYGAMTPATLVQFIELSRLLGAQHFVFYVSTVSEPLRRVLEAYEADGLVTTIVWDLPAVVAQSVWYNGQLLAANDCLYRTSHAFHYVAFNDVDEFIVPHSATNWSMMLAQLTTAVHRQQKARNVEQTSQRRSVLEC